MLYMTYLILCNVFDSVSFFQNNICIFFPKWIQTNTMQTPEIIISGKSIEVKCISLLTWTFEVIELYFVRDSLFWLYITFP